MSRGDALHSERVLLGLCIVSGQVATIADVLTAEHFQFDKHGRLWTTLLEHSRRRLTPGPTVVSKLHERVHGTVDSNELVMIAELPNVLEHESVRNVEFLAEVVVRASQHREKLRALNAYREAAEVGDDGAEIESLAALMQVKDRQARRIEMAEAVDSTFQKVLERVEALAEGDEAAIRLPIGFPEWMRVAPITPGTFTILGARPSAGKSALIGQVTRSVGLRGVGTGLFSLEMPASDWIERMLASGVNPVRAYAIRGGLINQDDQRAMMDEAERIRDVPVTIYDRMGMSWAEIETYTHALLARRPETKMVVVDHVGLVRRLPREDRLSALERIAHRAKKLARETDLAVVCLSQLNREVEKRSNHEPSMADLYGADALGQTADNVFILHQPHQYDVKKPKDEAELHIVKARHGEKGKVLPLWWDAQYVRFRER